MHVATTLLNLPEEVDCERVDTILLYVYNFGVIDGPFQHG